MKLRTEIEHLLRFVNPDKCHASIQFLDMKMENARNPEQLLRQFSGVRLCHGYYHPVAQSDLENFGQLASDQNFMAGIVLEVISLDNGFVDL